MKGELNAFKKHVSNLEGVMEIMEDKQSIQIEEYEQQLNKILVEINSLNQNFGDLNQDISLIMNKLKQGNASEKINAHNQSEGSNNLKKEVASQLNDLTSISPIKKTNLPPSYKHLRSMLNTATEFQEAQNNTMPIHFKK